MRRRRFALVATIAALGYVGGRRRLRRYEIAEGSMQPSLAAGDYVIARAVRGELQRGDIVIFDHPQRPKFELVKRVVGLPGELVAIHNGQVHVSGATVAEPWADGPTLPDGEWDLGPGEVFLLGDNRSMSAGDSRTVGPVAVTAIRWRVVARYWPPTAVGKVGL